MARVMRRISRLPMHELLRLYGISWRYHELGLHHSFRVGCSHVSTSPLFSVMLELDQDLVHPTREWGSIKAVYDLVKNLQVRGYTVSPDRMDVFQLMKRTDIDGIDEEISLVSSLLDDALGDDREYMELNGLDEEVLENGKRMIALNNHRCSSANLMIRMDRKALERRQNAPIGMVIQELSYPDGTAFLERTVDPSGRRLHILHGDDWIDMWEPEGESDEEVVARLRERLDADVDVSVVRLDGS